MPALQIEEYQAGWICALPKELTAARAMLDEKHEEYKSQSSNDNNNYVLGRIHGHNVVLACLPAGICGTVSAATVAVNMLRTFTGIRFGLMVGIGGGIPNLSKGVDVRLGDVVVSQPDRTSGGVVQFDLRKNLGEGVFEQKGFLRPPPTLLLTALANFQSIHPIEGNQISKTMTEMLRRLPQLAKSRYIHPGAEKDVLHCSSAERHKETGACLQCQNGIVQRQAREDPNPEVHYGVIASGNELMKNVVERDRLGQEFGAKCVEMEAAGLMNDFPCLVIRGICDYADSHKNDIWQEYAAVTAAAFAKELLSIIKPAEVERVSCAAEITKYSLGLNLFDAPDMGEGLFVGRQTELYRMESILQPDSDYVGASRKVLIIGGMGGIGKTQLAISYAKRHRSSYSSILWLNATSEAALQTSLRLAAHRIFPPETISPLEDDQLRIRISNWLSELGNARWLLIFDNHDDPSQCDIAQYFPFVAQGSIIITTRQPDQVNGSRLKLQAMIDKEEGLRILATRSGRDNVISDPDAQKLAERLDGHPLALATAGAFLSQSSVNFSRYLQQYEARWKVIDSVTALSDYPSRTLYSTWDISFAQIQEVNERAACLLKFLAYFDHQDIWYGLLQDGQGDDQPAWFTELARDEFIFEEAMQTLSRYCLVEPHHQSGSYSLHVCVHDWTLAGLNCEIDSIRFGLAIGSIAGCVIDVEWSDLAHLQYYRLNAHAERLLHDRFENLLNTVAMSEEDSWKVQTIADLLSQQMHHRTAEEYYQRALAGYEKVLGPEHTSTLDTINNLGVLYSNQDKLSQAEEYYQRALVGREKALGLEHTSTLDTVNNLGNLYRDQDKLTQAEEYYQRALTGYEKVLSPEHTSTLDTINNLGVLYSDQDKLSQAEEYYRRALIGKEKALGPEHTSTLDTVNNLGNLYSDQDKLTKAEEYYRRALIGYEKALGLEHTSTLETVNKLADLYNDQGKLTQAEDYYQRALIGREKALGLEHTSTLDTINNLGNLYRDQGKLVQAEEYYQRALVGREKALGLEHTSTLQTVNNLGNLYRDQGKLVQAEEYYQRALVGREKVLGPEHTSTLQTVNNLGVLYSDQGKLAQAEEYYQQALTGYERALGPEHTSTLDTINNLGVLYNDQDKLSQTEEYYQRALIGREKALGPEHTSTLDTVNNLGNLYRDQGKLVQAEEHYQRALAGYEKACLSTTIPALNTIYNSGLLFRDQGMAEEAQAMLQRALLGLQEVLGSDHSDTLQVARDLEELSMGMEIGREEAQSSDSHRPPAKKKKIR